MISASFTCKSYTTKPRCIRLLFMTDKMAEYFLYFGRKWQMKNLHM